MFESVIKPHCSSLVSVAIPAYNHESYVQDSIMSILEQDYQNIELLVIDDGSSDGTWDKIQEMHEDCRKRFSRVVMYRRPNKGRAATFNELLFLARGEYFFIVASDDMAKPQTITRLSSFLEMHHEYVMAVGDNDIIDENNNRVFWDSGQNNVLDMRKAKYRTFGELLSSKRSDVSFLSDDFGSYASLLKGNYIPNGYLVRRSALVKFGGYTDKAPLEDVYQHLQLAKQGKIKFIDDVLFSYRWHSVNTVKSGCYMERIAKKTFIYEDKLVHRQADQSLKDIFELSTTRSSHWLIDLRPILGIVKIKCLFYKKINIILLGMQLQFFIGTLNGKKKYFW